MDIEDILNTPFTFTKRRNHTPCDSRPLWMSCLIVLIIGDVGKNGSASLKKIHTANWIVRKEQHHKTFMEWAGKDERKRPDVRLEPSIDRVVDIMISNGVVESGNGKIKLTDIGNKLYEELREEDIFIAEKNSLASSKRFISEAAVDRLFKGV